MNLFNRIPANFFSLLASSNREIYFDALMLLNSFLKNELNIRVDDYVSSLISLIEDRAYIVEAEDDAAAADAEAAEDASGGLSANAKARLILARIVKTGWVDREYMDGAFVEIITPRDYAIKMMQALDELCDEKIHEYNSLVFSTYSGLKQAKNEDSREMFEALLGARRNTEQLTYELKGLYHGIRNYLRRIQEQNDINDLLENHFEKYKPMTDRIYHPIKTMDSVHRYMTPIKDILTKLKLDETLIANMRNRAMMVRKYKHEEEAGKEILDSIEYVLDVYNSLGGIITEIDKKHSAYTKNSIEKMTYMLNADQSIKGKLVDILKVYSNTGEPKRETISALFEKHIRMFRQSFIDGASLYHKNITSRRTNEEAMELNTDSSFADNAMLELAKQMSRVYSFDRVRHFVESLFAPGETLVESKNLFIGGDEDFILLILAIIRSNERGTNYTVCMKNGTVRRNGYLLPNMRIQKKEGKDDVSKRV
jgi:hypothetical protein